jgi:hydroxymethylpyrimidine/phosphomethylpyrimidine kinase
VSKRKSVPIALTIAGSDSGGGAGIQADLKTFAAVGVHGTSVITCITAQNPIRVYNIEPCSPAVVGHQLEAVFEQLSPNAIKTGMLYSATIIETVIKFLQTRKLPPLVVDPVMISTSGARLLEPDAIAALTQKLLPLATVVTPNLHEAEVLAGLKIRSPEAMREAARIIQKRFGCAALVKGGHLPDASDALDILHNGRWEMFISTSFVKNVSTHGTGCTFSAALAAYLACGLSLRTAFKHAKGYISEAIKNSRRARKHYVLGAGNEFEHIMRKFPQKKMRKLFGSGV